MKVKICVSNTTNFNLLRLGHKWVGYLKPLTYVMCLCCNKKNKCIYDSNFVGLGKAKSYLSKKCVSISRQGCGDHFSLREQHVLRVLWPERFGSTQEIGRKLVRQDHKRQQYKRKADQIAYGTAGRSKELNLHSKCILTLLRYFKQGSDIR